MTDQSNIKNSSDIDEKLKELVEEITLPITLNNESIVQVLNKFLKFTWEESNLDSWVPLSNKLIQQQLSIVLLGVAIQLGQRFLISEPACKLALVQSVLANKYIPNENETEVVNNILYPPDCKDIQVSIATVLYELGIALANKWVNEGVENNPPKESLSIFIELINEHAKAKIANPDALLQFVRPYLSKHNISDEAGQFFQKFQNLFRFTFCSYYPITKQLLDKYKDRFKKEDWVRISNNPNLDWSDQLIRQYVGYWDWDVLSSNTCLPWSQELLLNFNKYFQYENLSGNPALPWSKEFLDINSSHTSWDGRKLAGNRGFPWNEDVIEHYKYSLLGARNAWSHLSYNPNLQWSNKLIAKFSGCWDWSMLSHNTGIAWLENGLLASNGRHLDWEGLSANSGLCWDLSGNSEYSEKLIFTSLSENPSLKWTVQLIEDFLSEWNWVNLSYNKGLPWDDNLIENYVFNWDWANLSANEGIPWSFELLKQHEGLWQWNSTNSDSSIAGFLSSRRNISQNRSIKWTKEMIGHFVDKLDLELIASHCECGVIDLPLQIVEQLMDDTFKL